MTTRGATTTRRRSRSPSTATRVDAPNSRGARYDFLTAKFSLTENDLHISAGTEQVEEDASALWGLEPERIAENFDAPPPRTPWVGDATDAVVVAEPACPELGGGDEDDVRARKFHGGDERAGDDERFHRGDERADDERDDDEPREGVERDDDRRRVGRRF